MKCKCHFNIFISFEKTKTKLHSKSWSVGNLNAWMMIKCMQKIFQNCIILCNFSFVAFLISNINYNNVNGQAVVISFRCVHSREFFDENIA